MIPINRLPNELLSAIFMYQTGPFSPVLNLRVDGSTQIGWIALTHVCRHWRNVALDTPGLWTSPDFSHPALGLEMLKRSKEAPLTINYLPFLTQKGWPVVIQALTHISHIANLKLFEKPAFLSVAIAILTQPAPELRKLHFASPSLPTEDGTSGIIFLPRAFLANHAPRLTHLEFDNCHIPWDSTLFWNISSLTCLAIRLGGEALYIRPTHRELLDILTKMPCLTKLELEGAAVPSRQSEQPHAMIPVNIPNLRVLCFGGSTIPDCLALLERTAVPDTAIVEFQWCKFEASSRSEMVEELRQFAPALKKILDGSGAEKYSITSLELGIDGMELGDLVLKSWTTCAIPPSLDCCVAGSCVRDPNPYRLRVEVRWKSETSFTFDDVVQAILPSLALDELQELGVQHDSETFLAPTLSKFFGFLPNLTDLSVWGDVLYDFVPLLRQHSTNTVVEISSTGFQTSSALAFPVLEKLTLKYIDFRFDQGLLDSFLDAYRYRKEHHLAIDAIEVYNCRLSDKQSSLLDREFDGEDYVRHKDELCDLSEDEEE
ncbi:hypothetical protein VNI00_004755 [Paramarasmius palmivorus]|uniref:F-box domain-containing protein n=1 Tax=Paramarasmius palmivorus TaxID=297713 RepID=A0AAW0DHT8_9AGAR